ncbi:MAG: oxaloacetate decarboxylase [Planctomycetota bacterium]|nr:oxaloacetate decarboxylase [Planctomycetota bacterium]
MTPGRKLRELLARPGVIRSLGAHDVLTALLMEQAGFESIFVGGFGTSAALLGLPDLNFLGLAEMVDAVRRVAGRVSVPVIADGDTGHGDLHNVARTVLEFEAAGAAGVILEDQVFPKRCGHFEGKEVIPPEEMELKIRAAARRRRDPSFVIVARTDARATHGLESAIDRVNRYCAAGADVAFVEAPESVEEIEAIAHRVAHPKLINMLAFGKTPLLAASELEDLGYKIVVEPIAGLLAAARAVRDVAEAFLRDGHTGSVKERLLGFDEMKKVLGLPEHLALRGELSSEKQP